MEELIMNNTPYGNPEISAHDALFQKIPYSNPQPASNMDFANLMNGTINAINDIAAQSNQFNMQAIAEVKSLADDKHMLQMTIERMKRMRQEIPNEYSINNENVGICIKPNGTRITVGKIKIQNISEYKIFKNNTYTDFIYVSYLDSKGYEKNSVISAKNLAGKNLVSGFIGFDYSCNKTIANEFLTWCITTFPITEVMIIPEFAGFVHYTENDVKRVSFICNDGTFDAELLQCCSENIVKNILISDSKNIAELNEYTRKYLDTPEKCVLFTCSICGLLSSLLEEISNPMSQILAISSPDADSTRQACYYLKVFNRDKNVISFDTNKATIRKTFHNAKDETVIINDCSIVSNEKRRTEMLQYILTLDSDIETKPHNTAIISTIAQYLIPDNQKMCFTLSSDFYKEMTQEQEKEMCYALDCITRYIINIVCSNYSNIKTSIKDNIDKLNEKSRGKNLAHIQSRTSYSVLSAIFFMLRKHLTMPVYMKDVPDLLLDMLDISPEITGDSDDAVVNEFTNTLNKHIRSGDIKILLHNKDMNFTSGQPCVIVKDGLLMLEEKTMTDIILKDMTTTDSVHHIIKSLENANLLHSTKKNRYPLTVYNNGESMRVTFIAMELDEILDKTMLLRVKENKYSEWFTENLADKNMIPIITNNFGEKACQRYEFDKADNMHCFVTGQSGSGKTHHLTERIISLQKQKQKVIVFDTSDSFTKEAIINNLSAGGDKYAREKAKMYVNDSITFYKIEQLGVPVDILKLEYPSLFETKRRIIDSIISSHISNMGKVQKAALRQGITDLIESNELNMMDLYERLTDSRVSDSLALQFEDMLCCFLEYNLSDKSWDEFLNSSKDIVVISSDAISGTGGSALVDMLLMSLFYNQRNNPKKHLAVFIDEIQNQNFSPNGAITQILKEGRKYHIALNYATQFLPSGNKDMLKVMNLAAIKVFLQPDEISAKTISKSLNVQTNILCSMNQGECYINGTLYNNTAQSVKNGIIHGFTYRNFVPFEMK